MRLCQALMHLMLTGLHFTLNNAQYVERSAKVDESIPPILRLVSESIIVTTPSVPRPSAVQLSSGLCPIDDNPIAFFIQSYIDPAVALFGVPANILTIIVLRSDNCVSTTRYLMLSLAVEDLLLIVVYSLYYILPKQVEDQFRYLLKFIDSPLQFLVNWVKFAETYTILLISIDRFLALNFPLRAAVTCRVSNARRGLAATWILGLLIKLPNLVLDYCRIGPNDPCMHCQPVFLNTTWYKAFYVGYVEIFDQIIAFLLPLFCLIVMNSCLIYQLRRMNRISLQMLGEVEKVSSHNFGGKYAVGKNIRKGYTDEAADKPRYDILRRVQGRSTLAIRECPTKHKSPTLLKLRWDSEPASVEPDSTQTRVPLIEVASSRRITAGQKSMGRAPKHSSRRYQQHRNISATLICVITLFILCETPTSIVFFSSVYRTIREQEANDDILETAISEIGQNTSGDHLPPIRVIENLTPNEFDKILYSIALLTAFINFASNFIIYGLVGRRFRRLLHRKLSSWLAALQFCRVCFRCLKDNAYTASYNANSVMRRPSPNKVLTRKKKTVLATKNLVRWQNQTSRLAEELTTLETSKISQTEQLLVEKEVKWELTPTQQPGVSDDVLLSACSKQIKKAKLKWGKAKSGLLQINNDAEETKGNALEFNGKDTEIKENKNAFRNKDSQRFHSNTVVGQIKQIEQKGEGILDSTEIKHAILFEKRTSEHSLGELRNVMQNEEPIRPNKGHDDNQIELENVEMLKIGKGEGTTSKVLLQHYDKNIPEEEEEQLASSNVDTCMNGTVPVPSIEFQKIQSMDPIHLNPNQPLKNTLV